jgi:hypothetical protein
MTPDEIRQFVDDLYEATGTGDWERASAMLTDDLVITEDAGLPMAGEYRGNDALQRLYIDVMGMLDVAALDRVETTVGGNYAVTILTMRFADPALEPADLCEMFEFRDGKCCRIKPYYYNPSAICAAAEAKAKVNA